MDFLLLEENLVTNLWVAVVVRVNMKLFFVAILVFIAGPWLQEARSDPWHDAYSKMDLSDLRSIASGQKVIRFTLLKSGLADDYSYSVFLGDKPRLEVKRYSKKDSVFYEYVYAITEANIKNLARFEFASGFWKLPRMVDRKGFDGAMWVLEAVRSDGFYNRTDRWSPLPPYYSKVMDHDTGELVKSPSTPVEREVKYSDEVGLDMLCLYILLMNPDYDELIY